MPQPARCSRSAVQVDPVDDRAGFASRSGTGDQTVELPPCRDDFLAMLWRHDSRLGCSIRRRFAALGDRRFGLRGCVSRRCCFGDKLRCNLFPLFVLVRAVAGSHARVLSFDHRRCERPGTGSGAQDFFETILHPVEARRTIAVSSESVRMVFQGTARDLARWRKPDVRQRRTPDQRSHPRSPDDPWGGQYARSRKLRPVTCLTMRLPARGVRWRRASFLRHVAGPAPALRAWRSDRPS